MPNVHHIGSKIFVHRMDYPSTAFPLAEKGDTQEIEWPFRTGKSLVMRLPFTTHAVCVGLWVGDKDEDHALNSALGARALTDEEREALDVW